MWGWRDGKPLLMETVRASHPAELAVLVPYLLGFHPERSFVLIGLEGKRLGLTQRMDLVPAEHARAVVRQMLGHVARTGARRILALAYESEEGESTPMRAELDRLVRARVIRCDVSIVIRDGRWYDPAGRVPRSRPEGELLPDPARVPAVATFVGLGRVPLTGRESLRELADPGADPGVGDVDRELGSLDVESVADIEDDLAEALAGVLAERGPVEARAVALVAAGLHDVLWRDAALAVLCPGWISDEMVGAERVARLRHRVGDVDHVVAIDRLSAAVRRTPRDISAPVLTVLAQVAWAHGDGALASVALEQALEVDPEHRLAGLLDQLVSAGVRLPRTAA